MFWPVLTNATTVSRPPSERQNMVLQDAGYFTAWVIPIVAKRWAEKREKEMNTDDTLQHKAKSLEQEKVAE